MGKAALAFSGAVPVYTGWAGSCLGSPRRYVLGFPICAGIHIYFALLWFLLSHSVFSVSISLSSIFPPKLCLIDSCSLQDHFSPLPAPLMWFNPCTYLIVTISVYFFYPQISTLQLQLSPRHLPLVLPCPSTLQTNLASCLFSQASACAPPCLSPGLRLVCFGFISSSLLMSRFFLETCRAYCQVFQTCSLHSSFLAEPPKLPLLHPLYATSKCTPSNLPALTRWNNNKQISCCHFSTVPWGVSIVGVRLWETSAEREQGVVFAFMLAPYSIMCWKGPSCTPELQELQPLPQHSRKAPVTSGAAAQVCAGLEWGLWSASQEIVTEALLHLLETHYRHAKNPTNHRRGSHWKIIRNLDTMLCVFRMTLHLCWWIC